jgi:hypothetical protein
MGERIGDLFDSFGNLRPSQQDEEIDVAHPDIYELFNHFNNLYFETKLHGVSVEWSSRRMTVAGGTCQKVLGGAIIKLSQPLLTLRPTRDLLMVLLHEMIHAYCIVNNIRDPDPGQHGPPFRAIMDRINKSTVYDPHRPNGGYNINVYHTMVDEVEYYKQHHWQCSKCGTLVKRSTNRPPQPADCRTRIADRGSGNIECTDHQCTFHNHLRSCGGEFIKVKEPEEYSQKNKKKSKKDDTASGTGVFTGQRAITGWLHPPNSDDKNKVAEEDTSVLPSINAVLQGNPVTKNIQPLSAQERRRLLEAAALRRAVQQTIPTTQQPIPTTQQPIKTTQTHSQAEIVDLVEEDSSVVTPRPPVPARRTINCPVCAAEFAENDNAALNEHLDRCLAA